MVYYICPSFFQISIKKGGKNMSTNELIVFLVVLVIILTSGNNHGQE